MYRIGIDLGGTNIAVGIVNKEKKVIYSRSIPTTLPQNADTLAKKIAEFVFQILENSNISTSQIDSAGIGIPGTVNPHTGMVEYANNLGFIQVPFTSLLGAYFPFPLYAANDAKAAAWGEYLAGAGIGSSSMLMVTLGTGIGGAMIFEGKLMDGFCYAAGEIGHMVIERNGKPCSCGRRGCFEVYASATALISAAREAAISDQGSLLYTYSNGDPEHIDGRTVFCAANANDPVACNILNQFISYLAEGVANLINIFQPEILCIGGGLSGAGENLLAPLRKQVLPMTYSRDSIKNTRIICAELGNDAGIIGAALLER